MICATNLDLLMDSPDFVRKNGESCDMLCGNLLRNPKSPKRAFNGHRFEHESLLNREIQTPCLYGSVFMPPKELWEAYSNRTVRPSVCPSRFRVWSISPIFFEVGIPNLVCGCILGWRSVAYHFWVTLTLTSDLVFRIIVSGAYLFYYLR